VLAEENYADIKKELGLNEDSVLVFISTEGDTDRKNYEDIVWDGKYPSVED
jgi:diaminopropionate ammonia-lyase